MITGIKSVDEMPEEEFDEFIVRVFRYALNWMENEMAGYNEKELKDLKILEDIREELRS